jgi:hypothetical protein
VLRDELRALRTVRRGLRLRVDHPAAAGRYDDTCIALALGLSPARDEVHGGLEDDRAALQGLAF